MSNKNYSSGNFIKKIPGGYEKNHNKHRPTYQDRGGVGQKKPVYHPVGTSVMISAHQPGDIRRVYMCEARIIRQPTYRTGPYKLLVTGVRIIDPDKKDQKLSNLLGLKLLRKQESVHPSKGGHWTRQETDTWVRLEDSTVEVLVRRAINNIRKEQRKRKTFGTERGA